MLAIQDWMERLAPLLEPHQLIIDRIQAFAGLGQELPQQIIHETGLRTHGRTTS